MPWNQNRSFVAYIDLYVTTKHIYITVQKFGDSKIFLMFLKEVSYAHQGYIYLIKNTVQTVILWKKTN